MKITAPVYVSSGALARALANQHDDRFELLHRDLILGEDPE